MVKVKLEWKSYCAQTVNGKFASLHNFILIHKKCTLIFKFILKTCIKPIVYFILKNKIRKNFDAPRNTKPEPENFSFWARLVTRTLQLIEFEHLYVRCFYCRRMYALPLPLCETKRRPSRAMPFVTDGREPWTWPWPSHFFIITSERVRFDLSNF